MNKIVIVVGSHKKKSQSSKVGDYLLEWFSNNEHSKNCSAQVLNLAHMDLRLWDEDFPDQSLHWVSVWAPVSDALESADAFIVITPEWGGMVPPMLKNFFLLCGEKELAHKPCLIVSVSSGLLGGSYPISELRSTSYKNNKICYIPEHLIIKEVEKYLNDFNSIDSEIEFELRNRIDYCLKVLLLYSDAFKNIRNTTRVVYDGNYEYGM